MGKDKLIFGLIQKREVKTYCFNKNACNQISFAALYDKLLGELFVCCEEECPYEERRLEWGECDSGKVWLRRLRPDVAVGNVPI